MARKKGEPKVDKAQEMAKDAEEKKQSKAVEGENVEEKQEETVNEIDPVEELKVQNQELNDKFLRLYSEFDNFRKRTAKEKLELSKNASEKIILSLLPVMDDFDRALQALENQDNEDAGSAQEGMSLIYNKLKSILNKEGLKDIEAKGKEFDTDFHEAITQIPAPEKSLKGKVVDEIEKGYELNGKVIRYAKVVVGS
ncbi:MAG: nucleotide exchange factor GrpE [Hyphomicrobiales bacterium]